MNNKLKSLIILRFGSQADFAKEMKIGESFVSRVIRERTHLSEEMKEKCMKALGGKVQAVLDTDKR